MSFGVVASYYFHWGKDTTSVINFIDETGWIPDGQLHQAVTFNNEG